MDRTAAVLALRASARAELDAVTAMAAAAYDEATHAESRAENKYDTRSLEASYLAAGQAVRVTALRRLCGFYDALDLHRGASGARVGQGALVGVEDEDGEVRWLFVAPEGGGAAAVIEGVTVRVVTPSSPLGEALVGTREGDEVELAHPKPHVLTVLTVVG